VVERRREDSDRPAKRTGAPVLRELAAIFLRLGATAFGGPAAHIAMFEDEIVRRRAWLSRERFLDMLGATNMIPGPNSTEMAIHVGFERAGYAGVVVAGLSFILPAALITVALAWAYVRFGALPETSAFLYGAKPAIIAILVQALWRLGRTALRSPPLALAAAGAVCASALGVGELVVLFGTAAVVIAWGSWRRGAAAAASAICAVGIAPAAAAGAAGAATASFTLLALFLFFLKVGAVLFGSGYVLLAFLRADLVEHWRWLTDAQLLDAVAVGQVTPGPVFTTATFVGYLLGGGAGALVATVGIFLPAFLYVALLAPVLPRLRRSPIAGAFLDGANAGSVALLAVVSFGLARSAIADPVTVLIAVAAGLGLFRFRLNSAWLVLGGGILGVVARG
jgi:chromate transporter